MRVLSAAVLSLGLLHTSVSLADGDAVAVFDIEARGLPDFTTESLSNFSDLLDGVVSGTGYATVPRSTIKKGLKQQQADSFKACYDESCQIDIGKAVAAQKAFASTWTKLGDACVLTVKLFDLRQEVTEFSMNVDAVCTQSGLRDAIKEFGLALKARGQDVGSLNVDLKAGSEIMNTPTDETGYLKVTVHPKGRLSEQVEIYINGSLAGTTNRGFFTKELPLGRYVVMMRTVGGLFQHQRADIRMTESGVRIPREGTIELLPMFGYLVVEGAPSNATVVIDGEPKKTSGRLRLEKRIGEYSVVVEAAGYLPSKVNKVTVPAGDEVRLTYDLVRNAGGLSVRGAPTGAQVKLDGAIVGTLPFRKSEIGIGDHIIEISRRGFRTVKKVISVQRGQTAALDVMLGEKFGRLKIESFVRLTGEESLIEADVYLDDRKVGTTPFKIKVRAEVPHKIVLGLGKARTEPQTVTLGEGEVRKARILVPSSWGGAVSNVRFDLVSGDWEVRSGPAVLKTDDANPIRPGQVPLDFFLSGVKVGTAKVLVSPNETKLISITQRPLSAGELESKTTAQFWRRWLSLGAIGVAAAVGGGYMLSANVSASDRDEAYQALMASPATADYDSLRQRVVDGQEGAASAQTIGLGVLVTAGRWACGQPTSG